MIQCTTETLISLIQARQRIPGSPHCATVRRWCHEGLHGVVLETVMVGGRRFTSQEAITRFIERLSHGQHQTTGSQP